MANRSDRDGRGATSEGSDALAAWLRGFVADPKFLERYPYYAAVLARFDPVADPSIEAMAVSLHGGRHYLHVNVDTFVRAPEHLRGILLHEVHHVVLGHLSHPKFFDAAHPDLMEIAEEVSANEHVEELLPDPMTWKALEKYGLRAGQSTLERYDKLVETRRAQGSAFRLQPRSVDAHPWSQRQAGARAGKARAQAPPGGVEHTRRLLESAIAESAGAAEQAAKLVPSAGLLAGRLPGRLIEELTGVTARPQTFVDWKTAMRSFASLRRAPVTSWSRPSRRFPGRIGQVPGRAWRPRPIESPHLLVAIDTSMSMTDGELAEIARQLVLVAELARLTIVQCDVEITSVTSFTGALGSVDGRGGTDLRPVFSRELLAELAPDGVIYFTDGAGEHPERAPELPVLWVLTKPQAFDCPWGERASMKLATKR